ncbi:MAG: hypothetical protein D6795_14030 [Deltaproteobacteria bacterium]|nr:MAG: hypothetical protein D6795_14030 [Deltaproteobacteria bacterium]
MTRTRIVAMALLLLAIVVARVHHASWRAFHAGRSAQAAGDTPGAIANFERAIHFYAPGSPWVESSVKALWAIGAGAEESGDRALALSAYRTLRSSLYAVRSTYTPFSEWIGRCDDRIARLVAEDPDYRSRFPGVSAAALEARVRENLSRNEAPDVLWSIVVEIGFFGWVGGTIGFILRALGESRETFSSRRAIVWGSIVVAGYALWIVGLMKA